MAESQDRFPYWLFVCAVLLVILAAVVAFVVTQRQGLPGTREADIPAEYKTPPPAYPRRSDRGNIRLYDDAEIRKIAKAHGVDPIPTNASLFQLPPLDVVPSAQSRPLSEVFRLLGIDEARLDNPIILLPNALKWQLSPSYGLICVGYVGDPKNGKLDLLDPKCRVYGVRIGQW